MNRVTLEVENAHPKWIADVVEKVRDGRPTLLTLHGTFLRGYVTKVEHNPVVDHSTLIHTITTVVMELTP